MNNPSSPSKCRGLARILVLSIFAGAAAQAESVLRPPTPASKTVAEVIGAPAPEFSPLDVGPRDIEAFDPRWPPAASPGTDGTASSQGRDLNLGNAGYRQQRDWRFRGSLAQEDVIDGTSDWRVGAWISREF